MAGPDGGGLPPTDEWDDTDRVMVLVAVISIPAVLLVIAVLRSVVEPMIGRWIVGQ
jgi:hypothetical protein